MLPIAYGLYIIDEQYYTDFPDPYLKRTKAKDRPTCYCMPGDVPGIYWMIPLSSQIQKYENLMQKRTSQRKPNDIVHIIELAGKKSAFAIGDIFPVTEEYICREFTIAGIHVVLMDNKDKKDIETKAKKILELIRRGITYSPTQADVLAIERSLLMKRGK